MERDVLDIRTGISLLVGGILLAALLAVLVSRWALKYDRRERRRQQDAARRRRVSGIDP